MKRSLRRVAGVYRYAALTFVNTLALLVLLNLGLALHESLRDERGEPASELPAGPYFRDDGGPIATGRVHDYYLNWYDKAAAPEVDDRAAAEMLADFQQLFAGGFVYQPWVGFAETPFEGRRVHVDVDPRGFPIRRTVSRAQDAALERERPRIRIFAMGGSTTFGYAVADEHTWPSALASVLNARALEQQLNVAAEVVNYGRAYFHPSQESTLALELLKGGERPDLFVFLDGVNAGGHADLPHFTDETARAFLETQFPKPVSLADVGRWAGDLPLSRFARERLAELRQPAAELPAAVVAVESDNDTVVAWYVQRFEQNRRIVEAACELYDCETLFLLQPNARVDYDLDLYRPDPPEHFLATLPLSRDFYAAMLVDSAYVDLSGLFAKFGSDRKAIVDDTHYSPAFNRFLAEEIAGLIDLPGLAARAAKRSPGSQPATGSGRAVVVRDG